MTLMDTRVSGDRAGAVDVHAHYFGIDLGSRLNSRPDDRWPILVPGTDGGGVLMLGDQLFRRVRSVLWDVDERVAELDRAGVAVQVISPVPITLAYWADRRAAVDYARASNDSIADAVRRGGGRLEGLGTLPLPHVGSAVAELHRAVADLGLRGVEIGSQVGEFDLDAPELWPLFEAAQELGAAILIHPTDGGGGVLRRSGQPYDFGLGMITDTAIAATALVFGGVLERYPRLRIALAHGCGTFAWAYPRLRLGASIFDAVDPAHADRLVSSLWVDSLVFDHRSLRVLADRFGGDHLLLGTDHPFIPGQLEGAAAFVDAAASSGALTREQARGLHRHNGLAFLGMVADEITTLRRPASSCPAGSGGRP